MRLMIRIIVMLLTDVGCIYCFFHYNNPVLIWFYLFGYRQGLGDTVAHKLSSVDRKLKRELIILGIATPFLVITLIIELLFPTYYKESDIILLSIPGLLLVYLIAIPLIWHLVRSFLIIGRNLIHYTPLEYETSGDAELYQNLYFCGAPEDYDKYYCPLVNELNTYSNRLRFYKIKNPFHKIKGMDQLFLSCSYFEFNFIILPVTKEFLSTPNYAKIKTLPIAIKWDIPILPFAMEPGLEEEFGRQFGDLQLIPYYEKETNPKFYKQYLDNVLSLLLYPEEELENILQVFDANIFISYRKKDREYIEQVMKLIHSDKRYQGVSIWYDSFLIPGEDFQDEIKEACLKSNLVAMLVTPRVLEKPNYILDVEYPLAIEYEKKILPYALEPTNERELQRLYKDLPACRNDESDFLEAIVHLIPELQDITDSNDPQKHYLLGLAYLYGIYVERDRKKATELLITAAHEGSSEANDKLFQLDSTSNGKINTIIQTEDENNDSRKYFGSANS